MFEKCRNNSLKDYGLCPSHYLSTMLKMTKNEFEFIPGPDLYIFFEKNKKGRISYISNRYSKANNKYLKSHDPKQESIHTIYLDASNF